MNTFPCRFSEGKSFSYYEYMRQKKVIPWIHFLAADKFAKGKSFSYYEYMRQKKVIPPTSLLKVKKVIP